MKNFFTLLICCCLFSSCSDDSTEATLTNPSTSNSLASKPEAKPIFDESYKGIYKGVVIGNISGALYIDILNDDRIWAKIQTDNHETYVLENVPLSGTGRSTLDLRKYRFANEDISFEMKLDDTGNNITISNFDFFSDTNADVCLLKEKSTSQIKCYTGAFISNDESGNVNFTSDGELRVKGLSKQLNATSTTNVNGEINIIPINDGILKASHEVNPIFKYQLNANLHFGQISGYLERLKMDGNWMYDNNEIGNWNATRIL